MKTKLWILFDVILFLVVGFVATARINSLHAQSTSSCDTAVANGEKLYQEKKYQESIDLLKMCISRLTIDSLRVGAYCILIYDKLMLDSSDGNGSAKSLAWDLHEHYSEYRPDSLRDTHQYYNFLSQAFGEYDDAHPWWKKALTWASNNKLIVAGGVVVIGGAIYAIVHSGQDSGNPQEPHYGPYWP